MFTRAASAVDPSLFSLPPLHTYAWSMKTRLSSVPAVRCLADESPVMFRPSSAGGRGFSRPAPPSCLCLVDENPVKCPVPAGRTGVAFLAPPPLHAYMCLVDENPVNVPPQQGGRAWPNGLTTHGKQQQVSKALAPLILTRWPGIRFSTDLGRARPRKRWLC